VASFGGVAQLPAEKKLPGKHVLLDSEHRFAKGKHHGVEELTVSSRRCFSGAEERRVGLAARSKVLSLNWISTVLAGAPRARFRD